MTENDVNPPINNDPMEKTNLSITPRRTLTLSSAPASPPAPSDFMDKAESLIKRLNKTGDRRQFNLV